MRLRRVATFNREIATRDSIATASAADFHRPIATAAGGHRRSDGLAPAAHHVRAVLRRLHPHAPRACFGVASHGNILGGRAGRSAMPHEACVIEVVATRHIVSVLLRQRLELRAISVNQADAGNAEHHCKHKATDTKIHDAPSASWRGISADGLTYVNGAIPLGLSPHRFLTLKAPVYLCWRSHLRQIRHFVTRDTPGSALDRQSRQVR